MKKAFRTPSIKKSISARTTGKAKRMVKKSLDPTYGKKGTGMIKDPKKAIYNKVYNATTVGVSDVVDMSSNNKNSSNTSIKQPDRTGKGHKLRTKLPDDYTVLDIETTGFDNISDNIIEIGAIKVRNDQQIDTFNTLVNPGMKISRTITRITGITNEELEQAPDFSEIADPFSSFLGDDIIIGHNVSFDIDFLYDSLLDSTGTELSNNYQDTLSLARKLHPEYANHKLDTVFENLNCQSRTLHRALGDCEITDQVYQVLKSEELARREEESKVQKFVPNNSTKQYEHTSQAELKEMKPTVDYIDESNLLFDKYFVFSGTLSIPRKEAQQQVVNFGGHNTVGVTKKTDYLVIGSYDPEDGIIDGKSSKQKKAEKLKDEGQHIRFITESEFTGMLDGTPLPEKTQLEKIKLAPEKVIAKPAPEKPAPQIKTTVSIPTKATISKPIAIPNKEESKPETNKTKKPFINSIWFVVLFLFLIPPVSIWAIWAKTDIKKPAKIVWTVVAAFITIAWINTVF